VASAIAASNRAVAEVAGEYRIAWHTAHRPLIAAAARWLPEPRPTTVLGIERPAPVACGGSSFSSGGDEATRG
jgi:hypothetical protein